MLFFTVSRQVVETGPFLVGQTLHLLYTFTWDGSAAVFVGQFKDILPPLLKYENTPVVYTNWLTDPITSVTAGDFIFDNANFIGSTTTALVEVKAEQEGTFSSVEWNNSLVSFIVESEESNWGEEIISPTNNSFEIVNQICIAKDSLVQIFDNQWIPIQKLIPGVLLSDQNGTACPVEELIEMEYPISSVVQIPTNYCLPLLLSPGHPILLGGKEILPENHPDAQLISLSKPCKIYTIITDRRSFINVQGIYVATWSKAGWDNFVANDRRGQLQRYE